MKPLLITLEYAPFHGGIAHYYEHLVKHYPGEMVVLAHNKKVNKQGNIYRRPLLDDKLPFAKWLVAYKQIMEVARESGTDHILVGHILPLGLPARMAAKKLGIKYSVILHGMDYGITARSWRKSKLADWIINGAEHIICGNNHTAKLVEQRNPVSQAKVQVVNPGVEPYDITATKESIVALRKKYKLTDKIVFLQLGRLVARKGVYQALEALKDALRASPQAYLVIIGNGPEEAKIKQEISDLNLEDHTLLLTKVNQIEKEIWLAACDALIMVPQDIDGDFEGFGIVYLEAGLAGKPVIAGDSGGVSDAVSGGETGYLVKPGNVSEIAAAMFMIARDKNLREAMGQAGRLRAMSRFSWSGQAAKMAKILNNEPLI